MKTIMLTLLLLFTASAQAAEERSWWQFWRSTADKTVEASNGLFTDKEKQIIRSFMRERRDSRYGDDDGRGRDKPKKKKKLPPGLKKKLERGGELPPGWQKKVARGEVLDADLYGRSSPLPKDLLRRLSTKKGTELRLLDDRVVRIMDGTRAVLDILQIE
ncbi:hypothetical protein ACFL0R_04765 [Pseudomonadota bacterium]